jgi:hypothetical protein
MKSVRVMLGNEPFLPRRAERKSRTATLPREITDYWLGERISVYMCGDVIAAREALKTRLIQVRTADRRPIHAKIYRGDDAVTLGSSNLTPAGQEGQVEANARWTGQEPVRLEEAKQLAETIWDLGKDYAADLDALLQRLLRPVRWEEALARACSEILEGEWAQKYTELTQTDDELGLWPSQEMGISEALWVLETSGSVLLADATGSGKTRMGAHLMRAIQRMRWRSGQPRADFPVLVCPPHIADQWKREAADVGRAIHTCSHGVLSHTEGYRHRDAVKAIRHAEILIVDEAHNFFNRKTARTHRLFSHSADHVLLFTATPINRGTHDLLSVIDLLGADNLEDEVLKVVDRLWRNWNRRKQEPSGPDLEIIRRALHRFIVRRTKRDLNRLITKEPERYKNALGTRCRFPEQDTALYPTGESEEDCDLAREIRTVAASLKGLTHLRTALRVTPEERARGVSDAQYLRTRLKAAPALAAYHVAVSLRSSRAALHEHLFGTESARARFDIREQVKSAPTGDVIGTLRTIAGKPPRHKLDTPLPEWLTDAAAHAGECESEIAKYEKIGELLKRMSGQRENAKARYLIDLLQSHRLVIAFDRNLITLHALSRELDARGHGETLLGTGAGGRQQIANVFALGSDASGMVALCSDAMSEGMNLQAASAIVHLDLPSVIRLVEQRIGRVDRMDSPHERIQICWPNDSSEFALRSDERLIERDFDVHTLLGSNMRLPDSFGKGDGKQLRAADVVQELDREAKRRERRYAQQLPDALEAVRSLAIGRDALVPPDLYEAMRSSKARIETAVSVVNTDDGGWVFLAIEGSDRGTPRWVFLPSTDAQPITEIEEVSKALRLRLSGRPSNANFDDRAATQLKSGVEKFAEAERMLLPRKKQRALNEMEHVLTTYRTLALRAGDIPRRSIIEDILSAARTDGRHEAVNLSAIADWWLDAVRPVWIRHLRKSRRQPARLKEIRKELMAEPLTTDALLEFGQINLATRPLDKRIFVAIIGLTSTGDDAVEVLQNRSEYGFRPT